MVAPLVIGAALGVGGAALAGSGKRSRVGLTPQQEEEQRRMNFIWGELNKRYNEAGTSDIFNLSASERQRRTSVFESRQAMTRQEILDQISAETAKAGLSGTTRPALLGAQALGEQGRQRTEFDIGMDELSRSLGERRFNTQAGLLGQMQGAAGQPQQQTFARSPTFGEQVGPALSGAGGQMMGLAALKYALGGTTTARTASTRDTSFGSSNNLGNYSTPSGIYGTTRF